VPNLAPVSFFTVVSRKPPMVSLTMQPKAGGLGLKDTLVNIRDTKAFGFCCSFAPPTRSGRGGGMTRRPQAVQGRQDQSFKGRQFNAEVILWGGI
jgi:hypothetical protein